MELEEINSPMLPHDLSLITGAESKPVNRIVHAPTTAWLVRFLRPAIPASEFHVRGTFIPVRYIEYWIYDWAAILLLSTSFVGGF
jgi:hypothetical protein